MTNYYYLSLSMDKSRIDTTTAATTATSPNITCAVLSLAVTQDTSAWYPCETEFMSF